MKLIVDSGATKARWIFCHSDGTTEEAFTKGVSPYFTDAKTIEVTIQEIAKGNGQEVEEIYFYGTGCDGEEMVKIIQKALQTGFPQATHFEVHSDMLAAARGLCGREAGIACILGTGSNSCFYDGQSIVKNIRGYGFILGDEGGGAALGKRLVVDWMYHQMPSHLRQQLTQKYQLSDAVIMKAVYRSDAPSRFLASLVPFIAENRSEAYFQKILQEHFSRFLHLMVVPHLTSKPDLIVHFTGSVGYYFQENIRPLCNTLNIHLGRFMKEPMDGLIKYHQ